jgi:UDP-N-acetylmuramoylalanine--D-glutamate ligase
MIAATAFSGRRVALFGLGGSGLATARALVAGGASVACWDDGEAGRAKARDAGLTLVDLAQADWSEFDSFVLSPGVSLTHPAPHWSVVKAHAAGVEIIGDIEVFCRERARVAPKSPFVAITGTNGKSTTTALVAHLFRAFGHDVQMGGNIGVPVLSLAPPAADRVHVVELSTFQIDLTPSLDPSVGMLLNLTPDHLDRHGTMENYAAIKERLVAGADIVVVALDDDFTRAIADRLRAKGVRMIAVSAPHPEEARSAVSKDEGLDNAIIATDGALRRITGGRRTRIASLDGIATLRGRHNAQNAAAAVAALIAATGEPDPARLQKALASFGGLAHRMEEVGRIGHVLYVNDSKATNADAAEKALLSFENIFWILGGRAKEGGIEPLRPLFPRVAKAYLIGEASADFARSLGGDVPHEFCGTLDKAVAQAAADASRVAGDPVVLLSPACASYDQFPNFEIRGDKFRDLVRALVAARSGAAA